MLRNISSLIGFQLDAQDGEIGKIVDCFFDGSAWVARYAVVRTGSFLKGEKVLIPADQLGQPDWDEKTVPVSLSVEQVKSSPTVDMEKPIGRMQEERLYEHYGWQPYWLVGTTPAAHPEAAPMPVPGPEEVSEMEQEKKQKIERSALRSFDEVKHYQVDGSDGSVGDLHDLLFDEEDWNIRYLVIDTGTLLPGRKVLLGTAWIEEIDWVQARITVTLSVEAVKKSPEYKPSDPLTREYEELLHGHYGRPVYWKV